MILKLILISKLWAVLGIIALILAVFRRDSKTVIKEMVTRFFVSEDILLFTFSFLVMYVCLPFTIPSSLNNIFKKK
jgi:hypothetical protein